MFKKKSQWRARHSGAYGINPLLPKNYNLKEKKPKSRFKTILQSSLTVFISVLMIYGIAQAGSLTPSASPAATMHTLQELWDKIAGTADNSATTADLSGNLTQMVKYIGQHMPGGFTYGSSDAAKVLTTAGGTYSAALLTAANVRSGVAFGVSSTGTYGGGSWTYGSGDATKVLTTADAAGTYNAANLAAATVKSGTAFGVSLTGDYPSSTNPLTGDTAATDAAAAQICNSNEAWTKAGALITGSLSVTAAYISTGNTYCGTAGTLLANLFNGTSGAFTGGSQANGGADDYNNSGAAASGRYAMGWTACTSGADNYCGTGDSGADAKDNSTGLIYSLPCNGSGCASFSDTTPITYSWDSSAVNNNSRTASQLCSDHAGWSLPHQKQLMQAYIDGSYGNLEASGVYRYYWSATTPSNSTTSAWYISLSNGITYYGAKTSANYVRCVR